MTIEQGAAPLSATKQNAPSDARRGEGGPLEYAPRAPWHRRRRIRRYFFLALLISGVGCLIYWRKPLIAEANLHYRQWACLRYSAPADQVVYEEDPAAAKLLTVPEYVALRASWWRLTIQSAQPTATSVAARAPECFTEFQKARGYVPSPAGIAFLGTLKTPAGIRRLAWVEIRPIESQPLYVPFELESHLILPAGWGEVSREVDPTVSRRGPIDVTSRILPPVHLRLYAGQVDPADASHFTVAYEMDDPPGSEQRSKGTIDGRLSADGSRITLTVRDGPAAPPSPWGTPIIPDP